MNRETLNYFPRLHRRFSGPLAAYDDLHRVRLVAISRIRYMAGMIAALR